MSKIVQEAKAAQPEAALADVMVPEAYVLARGHVWRSYESWQHFYRSHRAELFARGAMLEVGGRRLVVAPKFDAAVLELSAAPRKTQPRAA